MSPTCLIDDASAVTAATHKVDEDLLYRAGRYSTVYVIRLKRGNFQTFFKVDRVSVVSNSLILMRDSFEPISARKPQTFTAVGGLILFSVY